VRDLSPPSPGLWLSRKGIKAAEILFYGGLRLSGFLFGFKPRHRAKDRRMLDEEILPRLAANDRFARVLFVGCDWYTEHVEDLFLAKRRTFTTIEIDPRRARHGAQKHIIAGLSELGAHVARGSIDLIVCNGVIGWGLDDPAEIEKSMAACVAALSPGGFLLLGWDDVPEKLPVPIEKIQALRLLAPDAPQGIPSPVVETGTYARHTFGFFKKPEGAS
jgi:SAM-dependent methyltransferase